MTLAFSKFHDDARHKLCRSEIAIVLAYTYRGHSASAHADAEYGLSQEIFPGHIFSLIRRPQYAGKMRAGLTGCAGSLGGAVSRGIRRTRGHDDRVLR